MLIALCPPLTAPDNGKIECTVAPTTAPKLTAATNPGNSDDHPSTDNMIDYVAGDICMFTCNKGYKPSGSEKRKCRNDGTWSGTDTTCFRPPGMSLKPPVYTI